MTPYLMVKKCHEVVITFYYKLPGILWINHIHRFHLEIPRSKWNKFSTKISQSLPTLS